MKKQTKEAVRPSRREPRTTVSSAQQLARVAQAGRCASPAGARARGAARGRGAVRGLSSATGESRARAAASRARSRCVAEARVCSAVATAWWAAAAVANTARHHGTPSTPAAAAQPHPSPPAPRCQRPSINASSQPCANAKQRARLSGRVSAQTITRSHAPTSQQETPVAHTQPACFLFAPRVSSRQV